MPGPQGGQVLVVRNIDVLLTMDEPGGLGRYDDAAIGIEGDRITWVGPSRDAPDAEREIDASGCVVLPGLVDCHTHLVWGGSRADEFERRLAGVPYSQILEEGGGILSTVRHTRAASDGALRDSAIARLSLLAAGGVTTVEVKSGYGLDAHHEPRLLRIAAEAGRAAGVDVVPTFLGAHTVPGEHRAHRERYVREIIEEQLPRVAPLARFADVYVDRGAFSLDEGVAILTAAKALGLRLKAHAEQVTWTGIAAAAARLGATSCEHLERIDDDGVAALSAHGTVAVLLPGAMLYLRDTPPPVAALREAGVPIAVATDLNPGTSPMADLWLAATLGCVSMRMTITEVLRGITAEGARALALPDRGRIAPGLRADLAIVRPPWGEAPSPAALVQSIARRDVRSIIGGVPRALTPAG